MGIRSDGRICFPDLNAPLRSHESYIQLTKITKINQDTINQDNQFHSGKTFLTEIPSFDLVFSVPYDYMHLVCIGVVKKLITFWVSSKHKHALPASSVRILDQKLNILCKYIPQEYQRKPNEYSRKHPFHDINRWKATELRQCLLYTGFVIFSDHLDKNINNNFVVLSVAIRIILSDNVPLKYYEYAKSLLQQNC